VRNFSIPSSKKREVRRKRKKVRKKRRRQFYCVNFTETGCR